MILLGGVLFDTVLHFLLHEVAKGCDGGTFAGYLGRNALGDLAGGTIVDEHIELGLALDVDKPGRDDQTRGIYPLRSGGIAQIANGADAVAANPDIPNKPGSAGAIHDAGSRNYEIEVGLLGATRHRKIQPCDECTRQCKYKARHGK